MFDIVLTFASEEQAHEVLSTIPLKTHARLPVEPVSNEGVWNMGCTNPGIILYIPEIIEPATYDEEGNELTPETISSPRVVLSGFNIGVTVVERSDELEALPNCRAVMDRDTRQFVHVAADVDPTILTQVRITPSFAGISSFSEAGQ